MKYQNRNDYQSIVESVRRCEDIFAKSNGGGWPGHTGPAYSRYPNLASEFDAREWQISDAADAACVSREVMAGVMEDGDELKWLEMFRIAWHIECNLDYLCSPVLSLVDPNTRKGRLRMMLLESLLNQMDDYKLRGGQPGINARGTLAEMKRGHLVTYAAWAWAVRMMYCFIMDARYAKIAPRRGEKLREGQNILLTGGGASCRR